MSIQLRHREESSGSALNVFVLFSGHNDRAVIALCRFFSSGSLPFVIVGACRSQAIFQTHWSSRVLVSRIDSKLDLSVFDAALQAVRSSYGDEARPVYCPTTEFMNHFVLKERDKLLRLGWCMPLPQAQIYAALTNKASSQEVVKKFIDIYIPDRLAWDDLRPPCVLKPRVNVARGTVYYPRLCCSKDQLKDALADVDSQEWFAERWIEGQSYYLCAYITKDGKHAHFWQQNLLQQPGGKSIVLARESSNPGLVIEPLLLGLVELGFSGPLMMEIIQDSTGRFYFIEINPRFWGPLQLALDVCPEILCLFAHDAGVKVSSDKVFATDNTCASHWYAWQHGAQTPGCRRYPAIEHVESTLSLLELLEIWDVYAKPDTRSLHGRE